MKRAYGIAASLASIALAAALCHFWLPANATTAALAFLVLILISSVQFGFLEAAIASLAASLCFAYFFLPPIYTFTINDPQNWFALAAFLAASLIGARIAGRARQRAADAEQSRDELERLYALSRGVLLNPASAGPAHIASQFALVFDCAAVALYDRASNAIFTAGPKEFPTPINVMRNAAITGQHVDEGELQIIPLQLGAQSIGSLGILSPAVDRGALEPAISLAAIALEQQQAQSKATRAELARRSEEMKSTLLDALAHEFKTPLTSIKAAASSRLETAPPKDRELWAIVNEETDRLDQLVVETIEVSRLEAGRIEMHKRAASIRAITDRLLTKSSRVLDGRQVHVEAAPDLPEVLLDPEMIEKVMQQLLENAAKYSPPGGEIGIRLRSEKDNLIVGISDQGPGVPPAEQERIFEKFYRGERHRGQIPGTGMGLAIAREIIHAHGGCLWVDSEPGKGASFQFSIPATAKEVMK